MSTGSECGRRSGGSGRAERASERERGHSGRGSCAGSQPAGVLGAGGAGRDGAADRGARVHMLSGLLSRPSCETGCPRTCGRSRSLPRAQSNRSSSNSIWSLSGSFVMRRCPPLRRALAGKPAAQSSARRASRSEITEQRRQHPTPETPQQRSRGLSQRGRGTTTVLLPFREGSHL